MSEDAFRDRCGDDEEVVVTGTTRNDFASARRRYLERLAALSELARLERAWSLPSGDEPAAIDAG